MHQPDSPLEYLYKLTVEAESLDEMNHVNNLVFLRWCLKSASAHSMSVGWSSIRYRESGFGFIVRSHKIKYKIPALLGDEIVVKTWVAGMERFSSKRRYHVIRQRDGRRLAEAETNWVFVNLESGELAEIPEQVSTAFGIQR